MPDAFIIKKHTSLFIFLICWSVNAFCLADTYRTEYSHPHYHMRLRAKINCPRQITVRYPFAVTLKKVHTQLGSFVQAGMPLFEAESVDCQRQLLEAEQKHHHAREQLRHFDQRLDSAHHLFLQERLRFQEQALHQAQQQWQKQGELFAQGLLDKASLDRAQAWLLLTQQHHAEAFVALDTFTQSCSVHRQETLQAAYQKAALEHTYWRDWQERLQWHTSSDALWMPNSAWHYLHPGDPFDADTVIGSLWDLKTLEIRATLPAWQAQWLQHGVALWVHLGPQALPARVLQRIPLDDQTYEVRVLLEHEAAQSVKAQDLIQEDVFIEASLDWPEQKIRLPWRFVFWDEQERAFVYRKTAQGSVEKHFVMIKVRGEKDVWVERGLTQGELLFDVP